MSNFGQLRVRSLRELNETVTGGVEDPPIRRNGRPRVARTPFNPRLLLMTHPSQLKTEEALTVDDPKPTGCSVKCGLCWRNVDRASFERHLAEHYGVGWIVGEPPIDITDRAVVTRHIIVYLREHRMTRLPCRMCDESFRRARTILNHIEQCSGYLAEQYLAGH